MLKQNIISDDFLWSFSDKSSELHWQFNWIGQQAVHTNFADGAKNISVKKLINAKSLSKIAFNCIATLVKKSNAEEISRQSNFFYSFPCL